MNQFRISEDEKRMQGAIDNLVKTLLALDLKGFTTLVDGVVVDAYGQSMKIKDLASVSVPEAKTIKINVWDINLVNSVEKGHNDSSLEKHITERQIIRINLPDLTAEEERIS